MKKNFIVVLVAVILAVIMQLNSFAKTADSLLNKSGSTNNISFSDVKFTSDRNNKQDSAILLDSSSTLKMDATSIGDQIKNNGAITISAFVRVDSVSGNYFYIMGFQKSNGNYAAMIEDCWGQYVLRAYPDGSEASKTAYAGEHSLGKWTHVAVIVGYGYGIIYIDGVEKASFEIDASVTLNDIKWFSIGSPAIESQLDANRTAFNGAIDEIAIYSNALSIDDIKALNDGKEVKSSSISYTCDKYDTYSEWLLRNESQSSAQTSSTVSEQVNVSSEPVIETSDVSEEQIPATGDNGSYVWYALATLMIIPVLYRAKSYTKKKDF